MEKASPPARRTTHFEAPVVGPPIPSPAVGAAASGGRPSVERGDTQPDTRSERRTLRARPLRDALEELVSVAATDGRLSAIGSAVRRCAVRARQGGVPPERFVVTLKRMMESRTVLATRTAAGVAEAGWWTPYERLVALAIRSYYDAP